MLEFVNALKHFAIEHKATTMLELGRKLDMEFFFDFSNAMIGINGV